MSNLSATLYGALKEKKKKERECKQESEDK